VARGHRQQGLGPTRGGRDTRPPAKAGALAASLLVAACAASPQGESWEEAARDGAARRTAAARLAEIERADGEGAGFGGGGERGARASAPELGPVPEGHESAEELELALLRFTSRRRELSRNIEPRVGPRLWPPEVREAWETILTPLERGLERPPGSLPRRLLIQTRVTLEVELENTERRFGPAAPELVERLRGAFAWVAAHMRAAREAPLELRLPRAVALSWPVAPVVVTSPFGYRRDPILGPHELRFHAGVDLFGDAGALVSAAGPGRVASAGWLGGHGRTVVVQHAGGYQTLYAHLSKLLVGIGAEVDAGTPVGTVGSSGRSTGPHLHFEVRHGGVPLDPLEVLGGEWSVGAGASDGEADAQGESGG
jgi:hypothetical protein